MMVKCTVSRSSLIQHIFPKELREAASSVKFMVRCKHSVECCDALLAKVPTLVSWLRNRIFRDSKISQLNKIKTDFQKEVMFVDHVSVERSRVYAWWSRRKVDKRLLGPCTVPSHPNPTSSFCLHEVQKTEICKCFNHRFKCRI